MKIDRTKTINQLEGIRLSTPPLDSHVVSETHRLCNVPLSDLGVEDLRLLVGQEIALDHIVPLALERLQQRPLASGDFYVGDLLVVLLRLSPRFWAARRDWRRGLDEIAKPVFERFSTMSHRKQKKLSITVESFLPAYKAFARVHHATT